MSRPLRNVIHIGQGSPTPGLRTSTGPQRKPRRTNKIQQQQQPGIELRPFVSAILCTTVLPLIEIILLFYFLGTLFWKNDHAPRPLCLMCGDWLANEAMKTSKLLHYIETKCHALKEKHLNLHLYSSFFLNHCAYWGTESCSWVVTMPIVSWKPLC